MADEAQAFSTLKKAAEAGNDVIFSTSPRFLGASTRAALEYPTVRILNCSLNIGKGHLRSYYGRMHEAKFLTGMIAGALTKTNAVGYLADYPIMGVLAGINAFALGMKMVNPNARLYLGWSTVKDTENLYLFRQNHVSHISGREMKVPDKDSHAFGLFEVNDEDLSVIASPIWHWGKFYERIVTSIFDGTWAKNPKMPEEGNLNYWWGLSTGLVDLIMSKRIPAETATLVELMKQEIAGERFAPFTGEFRDQSGRIIAGKGEVLTPEQIIDQNWLLDNIEGALPVLDDMKEVARPIVETQAVPGLLRNRTGGEVVRPVTPPEEVL